MSICTHSFGRCCKELIGCSFSGAVAGRFADYMFQSEDLTVQGIALGTLNAFAVRTAYYFMDGNKAEMWELTKMVTVGLTIAIGFSALAVESLSLSIGVALTNGFVYALLMEKSPEAKYSNTSSSGTTTNQSGSTSFYVPDFEDFEVQYPICQAPATHHFYDYKYLLYGCIKLADLSADQKHLDKVSEDTLLAILFDANHLCTIKGKCLGDSPASDYLVVEHIVEGGFVGDKRTLRELFSNLIEGIKNSSNPFPKKVLIPFSSGNHCAALALELEGNNFYISGVDSMGLTSMIQRTVPLLESVLKESFPSTTTQTICNRCDQNNQMSCGFHLVHNIYDLSLVDGLIFEKISQANQEANPEFLGRRTSEYIHKIAKKLRSLAMTSLKDVLEANPDKILVKGKPYSVDLSIAPRSWN